VNTCFFTNYFFEHNGKRINDYDVLLELDLKESNKIYMRPDVYNERTARLHFKRFKDVLYTPGVLNLSNDLADTLSAALSSASKSETSSTTAASDTEEAKKEKQEPKKEEDKKEEKKEEKKQLTEEEKQKFDEERRKYMEETKKRKVKSNMLSF
jgi:flagellar biosynthesis GTPase FlhF